jgi:hypothetical protein
MAAYAWTAALQIKNGSESPPTRFAFGMIFLLAHGSVRGFPVVGGFGIHMHGYREADDRL